MAVSIFAETQLPSACFPEGKNIDVHRWDVDHVLKMAKYWNS